MDVNSITTLLSTFGFPVVACLCMGYFIVFLIKTNNEQIKNLTKALNNNTNVMTEINTLLKVIFTNNEKEE